MTRRVPFVLAVVLLLSLPGAEALAGGLYRWVTSDGRVEIGPMPPPGVNAVPWSPGQPEVPPAGATPASPAPTASEAPADAEPAPSARASRPSGPALAKPKNAPVKAIDDCSKLVGGARNLARQVSATEKEIAQLEAKLEKLESSDVAFSHTECAQNDSYGRASGCRSSSFDRDAEISKTQVALDRAQEKLDEVEEKARRAGIPAKCM